MKTINSIIKKLTYPYFFLISMSIIALAGCKFDKKTAEKEQVEPEKDTIIEIVTELMDFQSIDTIPSGWNTFKYLNNSNETHLFLLDKYPDGKTIVDTFREIIPPFQNGMDLINEGKPDEGYAEFNKLPAWFFEVVFSGGSGLVSPKKSSLTTLKLEPGYYLMECYVKMENGKFHTTMGMAKPIIVTNEDSGNIPPEATVDITISSTEGINYEGAIEKGEQVFAVHFKDQIAHEHFLGHDVNLVRLNEKADLEALEKWMDWSDPKGLIMPAPEGVIFMGGVNDLPAGRTGYFTAVFEPGTYALIAEVPKSLSKKMLKTFEVSD